MIFNVVFNDVLSAVTNTVVLTAGMVNGRAVKLSFSSDWESLNKTVVFTNGIKTISIPEYKWVDNTLYIPPEVLDVPHKIVKCGAYGVDSLGEMIIPTLWTELGRVFPSASPKGFEEEVVPPTPEVWVDLQNQIGALNKLNTQNKSNLVEAVNEALTVLSSGVSFVDTLPEPSKEYRGRFIIVSVEGSDKLFICLQVSNEYKWVEFSNFLIPDTPVNQQ